MKTEKIDKDIQKLKDKISELQGQLKAKERQKTEMENAEIASMIKSLQMEPEDMIAIVKAYQEQQSQKVVESVAHPAPEPEPEQQPPTEQETLDAKAIPTESEIADDGTAVAASDYGSANYSSSYSSDSSYDYNSGGSASGRYSFEESED